MNVGVRLASCLAAGATVVLVARMAPAQATPAAHAPLAVQAVQTDTALKRRVLLTRRDAGTLGAALVGSALLIGVDRSIADGVRESTLHENGAVRGLMNGARFWGDPGVLVAGAGLWVAGELANNRQQRLLGVRSVEAIVASGVVTVTIKAITGRARPNRSPTNERDFVFARGMQSGSAFEAFPSGHATAAFAFAAAVDAEWARLSPRRPRWVAPALYGVAALTGVSRMFHDLHWTSDVLMGSAIGYVTGHAVVRWHADQAQVGR